MPTGKKKGEVHEVFKERLTQLEATAEANYEGLKQEGQRIWDIPTDLTAPDLFTIAQLHEPSFDREAINTNYSEVIADGQEPGTVGDAISLTMQCDYNACEERAFRFRHASVVRNIAHAAARQRGRAVGPMFSRIEEDAANSIQAGATS